MPRIVRSYSLLGSTSVVNQLDENIVMKGRKRVDDESWNWLEANPPHSRNPCPGVDVTAETRPEQILTSQRRQQQRRPGQSAVAIPVLEPLRRGVRLATGTAATNRDRGNPAADRDVCIR